MYKENNIKTLEGQEVKDKPIRYLDVEVTHKDVEEYLKKHKGKKDK